MTDVPTPPGPDEADRRDENLAALLAVPPLDEVTRRRMVRTAVGAASGPRSRLGLMVPVAAAIVVGLVIGAVVVSRPEDTTPTAQAPASTEVLRDAQGGATDEDSAASPQAPALESAPVPFTDLGALGDVGTEERLAAAVSASQKRAADAPSAAASTPLCATTPPRQLGLSIAGSVGTGTVDGNPVTVLLGTDTGGQTVAVALSDAGCVEVLRTVVDLG